MYQNLVFDAYGELRQVFKCLGQKDGNKFVRSESQIDQFKMWWDNLKDGTMIKCEYKIFRPHGTQKQAGAHFGLVIEMIRKRMEELGWDICGVLPNKEMIHEILKKCCGGVGENGGTMNFRDMDAEQRSKFFENCRAWAATQLSLNIPDPDPNWKEK
jgi:hypothetical protein